MAFPFAATVVVKLALFGVGCVIRVSPLWSSVVGAGRRSLFPVLWRRPAASAELIGRRGRSSHPVRSVVDR
jgi:hypothetical protein